MTEDRVTTDTATPWAAGWDRSVSRAAYRSSRVRRLVDLAATGADRLSAGSRRSLLGRALSTLATVTKGSSLFRWLTAEPEANVVVIDLTQTVTVAPVIRVFDWIDARVQRAVPGSRTSSLGQRGTAASRHRPVQLFSALVLSLVLGRIALAWPAVTTPSVGPLLGIAALALLGLRLTWTWDELVESKPGKLVGSILTPPDPPERTDR